MVIGKPERLVRRHLISTDSEARINLTERVWSRKSEFYFRKMEQHCSGVTKIFQFKKSIREWIVSNVPLHKE